MTESSNWSYITIEKSDLPGRLNTVFHPPIGVESLKQILASTSPKQKQYMRVAAANDLGVSSVEYLIGTPGAYRNQEELVRDLDNKVKIEGYYIDLFGVEEKALDQIGQLQDEAQTTEALRTL